MLFNGFSWHFQKSIKSESGRNLFKKQNRGRTCMATIARQSSTPAAAKRKFDAEVDVITIGSWIAGLATALFSR
jgi:hypothetical protein